MDLHAWITQQVDRAERLIDPKGPPTQVTAARLRCEADRRILDRHRLDTPVGAFPSCAGCGNDDMGLPNIESANDCPELLDLAHAHGLTDDILAGLDRPQPPKPKPRADLRHEAEQYLRRWTNATPPITTSDVPNALRGPRWKP